MIDPKEKASPIRGSEAEMRRNASKMHIRFRVIEAGTPGVISLPVATLFVSENYPDAERFCWNYGGEGELQIEKVWIRKALG